MATIRCGRSCRSASVRSSQEVCSPATGAMWRNWARTEAVRPLRVERPATADAVQRAVAAAAASGLRIKPIGASHSFTGIAVAPDVQLDLADLSGVIEADAATRRVRLGAGTPLHRLPHLLEPYGLAMANMGDIDRQTISGAISTGTHGTGRAFGGIATRRARDPRMRSRRIGFRAVAVVRAVILTFRSPPTQSRRSSARMSGSPVPGD